MIQPVRPESGAQNERDAYLTQRVEVSSVSIARFAPAVMVRLEQDRHTHKARERDREVDVSLRSSRGTSMDSYTVYERIR